MSGPDREADADAQYWWRLAADDLGHLDEMLDYGSTRYRHMCAAAQQCAEKALKAALAAEGLRVPRSHDLVQLAHALPPAWRVPPSDEELAILSAWSTAGRYPAPWEDVTADEMRECELVARSVFAAIEAEMAARGLRPDTGTDGVA